MPTYCPMSEFVQPNNPIVADSNNPPDSALVSRITNFSGGCARRRCRPGATTTIVYEQGDEAEREPPSRLDLRGWRTAPAIADRTSWGFSTFTNRSMSAPWWRRMRVGTTCAP
jgi:hypothetical protein